MQHLILNAYTYPNGVKTDHTHMASPNRLWTLGTEGSAVFQDLAYGYGYDNVGNVTSITDGLSSTRSQVFTYDELNRLTTATSEAYDAPITYTYNKIGNIINNSRLGQYTYGSKPHAVIRAGADTNTYTYDANGNMKTMPGGTISYDRENRVSSITRNGVITEFTYDYRGERARKATSGSSTLYLGRLYECTDGTCTKHIFAGGKRIASQTPTATNFYHADHLGGLNVVTNSAGATRQKANYYPFGETRIESGTANIPYKFTGQEEDKETGLYYYGARYYDPVLARFISADSIVQSPGDPQSLNRYTYARNNPLYYVDPSGHFFEFVLPFLGMMGAGAAFGAGMAALTGQDPGMGALTGAISAAAFMGAHAITAQLQGVVQAALVHAGAGAASGAVNASITGGDPGLAAASSGISAGIARYAGGYLPKSFPVQFGGRMAIGAVTGGITSTIMGGSFGQGASLGASTAMFGLLFNDLRDLQWAREVLKYFHPEYYSDSADVTFADTGHNLGETNTLTGDIRISNFFAGSLLNSDRQLLVETLAHEFQHSNDPLYQRTIDASTDWARDAGLFDYTTAHHMQIYLDSQCLSPNAYEWMKLPWSE